MNKIFIDLRQCIICPRKNRTEETVTARLHIGHSFITYSFLLKDEEPPVCIGCDERLTIEHILLTCSDFIEMRESHFTAQSLLMLKTFNCFKTHTLLKIKYISAVYHLDITVPVDWV